MSEKRFKDEKSCSNCRNQMTGFDGGFFGLALTCECKICGETENRKNCSKFEKKITKGDLLDEIAHLKSENEQLRQQLQEMKSDEKLYAQEILELNKTKKEMLNFKQLGGDY